MATGWRNSYTTDFNKENVDFWHLNDDISTIFHETFNECPYTFKHLNSLVLKVTKETRNGYVVKE